MGSKAMQKLIWYGRRLRAMGMREIVWRTGQTIRRMTPRESKDVLDPFSDRAPDWVEAFDEFRAGRNRPILIDRRFAAEIAERRPDLVAELISSANQAASGRFRFFGYPAVSLSQPIDWHHDPIADVRWPDCRSERIDHRTAGGDVKWIWELNRLQHLPLLAQAWLFTGDNRYSETALAHIESWIEQNPAGRGIAWRGAFEVGMRAISVAVAVQGLRDADQLSPERYRRIVTMLARSGLICWRDRSRFSSANNHLVGEMAGLAVISILFPELPSASRWERQAVQKLTIEAQRQILPDGAGAEQSVAYQMATVELLHLVATLLVCRDGEAPVAIVDAIRRSSAFLTAAVGDFDPDPRYGDSDQEFALRLGAEEVRTVRDHLGLVTMGSFATAAGIGASTLTSEWFRSLWGRPEICGSVSSVAGGVPESGRSFFANVGGLVVLRRGRRRTTMDVGPLGYLSLAAHGHADALAVTISEDGEDIIGDPGTGSYYRHPQWRAMMRGTRAHATVCVDGQNQSLIGGPFLWSRHAETRLRRVDLVSGIVDAEHNGYQRLLGGVVHRRWLIAPHDLRAHLVVDFITGGGRHEVRTVWPIHPAINAHCNGEEHLLVRNREPVLQLLHAATEPLEIDDVRGDDIRALGWWSHRLENREPAWWLSAVCNAHLPVAIATLIVPTDGVSTSDLAVAMRQDVIEVTWAENEDKRGISIRIDQAAHVTYQ